MVKEALGPNDQDVEREGRRRIEAALQDGGVRFHLPADPTKPLAGMAPRSEITEE